MWLILPLTFLWSLVPTPHSHASELYDSPGDLFPPSFTSANRNQKHSHSLPLSHEPNNNNTIKLQVYQFLQIPQNSRVCHFLQPLHYASETFITWDWIKHWGIRKSSLHYLSQASHATTQQPFHSHHLLSQSICMQGCYWGKSCCLNLWETSYKYPITPSNLSIKHKQIRRAK